MPQPTPIQIIEITKQALQGFSEPYLCRGENGLNYYVKGRQSGLPSRINEWLCAHLGRAFGLPIPEFELAEISPALLGVTAPNLQSIGLGLGFASQEVPLACWLEVATRPKVDDELQRKLLVFDWWIRNKDRSATTPTCFGIVLSKKLQLSTTTWHLIQYLTPMSLKPTTFLDTIGIQFHLT